MEKTMHLTRVISKYAWDADAKESRKFDLEDKYDPMNWDDFVNNLGYLAEGHKGQAITIKFMMEKEEE